MRVLLVARDLYKTVGGSETVYKKIIEANPGVEFVYFRVSEPADARRPSNVRSVALEHTRDIRVAQPFFSKDRLDSLREAEAYARSVAGQSFDVVELPDYFAFGVFLRDCLVHHQVKFSAIVLAMFGNISISLALGWDSAGRSVSNLQILEYEQFVDSDARYAVSKRDVEQWQARANLDVYLLDPLAILAPSEGGDDWIAQMARPAMDSLAGPHSAGSRWRPDLYCLGRMERRKGNDLFVDIIRWLDRGLYGNALHVGSDDYTRGGLSSGQILSDIARARETQVAFLPNQDKAGLASIFRGNSVVVLPVRYDLLNLVALESVFSGCPTVISSGAGICDYLDDNFPTLPYIKLDLQNIYGVLPGLESLLENYDGYKRRLVEQLLELKVKPGSWNLDAFYADAISRGLRRRSASGLRRPIDFDVRTPSLPERGISIARHLLPARAWQLGKGIVRDPKGALREFLLRVGFFSDAKLAWYALQSLSLKRHYRKINALSENSIASIEEKVRAIYRVGSGSAYRCNIWREMARLEVLRGNELVAVSYELRLMRLLGGDVFGQLPAVVTSLERNGFAQEALVCKALYESPEHADERAFEYLQSMAGRFLENPPRAWEFIDDRRKGTPRVAVIVSLYNAAPKLRLFLTALARQTLVRSGQTEIILVDSGSKTDEYRVTKDFLSSLPLNLVYARSRERETIQAAWNRGIGLARAPYLVFLGADETIYPETLETLATELDQHPGVDWVMANSLVTEVDEHGVFTRDIMPYDRTGATKDHAYLETCYLSWVGGMYRKSIHERFGYYDESFRAAGDSEFKNRVLPRINVRFIPKMLGLFLNYPDERTTASPVAEIEDTRAWYLHRSAAGVRYAFDQRDPADALQLFYAGLGYRKSYCRHTSCDIEYSSHLLRYAMSKGLAKDLGGVERDLARLLDDMRHLEWADAYFSIPRPALVLAQAWRDASAMEKAHTSLLRGKATPTYKVLNDNRYEQHTWLWDTI